jgi:F-type H+-transporting ATPase subunit a
MRITPDQIIYWQWGPVSLNATLIFTWIIIALLTVGAHLVTRRLSSGPTISRGQNMLEVIVLAILNQIREASQQDPRRYLPFIGTLFIFVATSNILAIVPWFEPPTSSLSVTIALALCVFVAVPIYGIQQKGVRAYLGQYLQPSPIMLPFNIIGEVSRTLALAVRLFGNMMSGGMIVAMLLAIAPLFLPIVMQAFGLLTGLIQAYIFAMLAMVYIASATRAHEQTGVGRRAEHKGDAFHG